MGNNKSFIKERIDRWKKHSFTLPWRKGRAGTIAAILLIEFNYPKQEAIDLVRSRRKGAIESKVQEEFIFAYRAVN